MTRASYTLNSQQLDAALAALAKASDTFRLSPHENSLYRALKICSQISVVALIGMAVLTLISQVAWTGNLGCLFGILWTVFWLAGFVAAFLLVVSFPLMLKTVRQQRLLKQLGLQYVSYSAWKQARRKRLLAERIGGAAKTTVGLVLLILAVILVVFQALGGTNLLLIAFTSLFFGVIFLVGRSFERSRERLEVVADADRLRATLTSLQTGPEAGAVVPAAVLEKVAGIEHAQIARERAHAVLAGVSAANRGYGVLMSRDVAEQKASLPAERRLDVEELIDQLAAEPSPFATAGQHGGGVLSTRTPDGSAEVDYSVDQPNRRIHVVALRTPGFVPSETSHAR